jgi:iron complex outermembrane receptor protein
MLAAIALYRHRRPRPGPRPATVLEEVTVTARRRTESLQDVPIAVSALTGDQLTLAGPENITELAQSVPSVTLEPSRATNTTLTAFIRGVGQQDPLAGFEQGVALYLDDVYLARPQGAMLDIYDVERIEVLRGPRVRSMAAMPSVVRSSTSRAACPTI